MFLPFFCVSRWAKLPQATACSISWCSRTTGEELASLLFFTCNSRLLGNRRRNAWLPIAKKRFALLLTATGSLSLSLLLFLSPNARSLNGSSLSLSLNGGWIIGWRDLTILNTPLLALSWLSHGNLLTPIAIQCTSGCRRGNAGKHGKIIVWFAVQYSIVRLLQTSIFCSTSQLSAQLVTIKFQFRFGQAFFTDVLRNILLNGESGGVGGVDGRGGGVKMEPEMMRAEAAPAAAAALAALLCDDDDGGGGGDDDDDGDDDSDWGTQEEIQKRGIFVLCGDSAFMPPANGFREMRRMMEGAMPEYERLQRAVDG